MNLAYCDMIAYAIKDKIEEATQGFIRGIEVKYDLAEEGYMQSTTKYIKVIDGNGKEYRVTVEEK